MVKNNQNFVKKTFLLLKYQKLLIFLVKNLLKKLSYFSRCFYMESPLYLLLAPPDDVLSKIADLSHYFKCQEKYEFDSNFFKTPI